MAAKKCCMQPQPRASSQHGQMWFRISSCDVTRAGREADSGGSPARRVGGAAELPPGSQLDAGPGEAVRCPGPGHHPPQLQAVAHLLPLPPLPRLCTAEWRQNDQ